MTVRISSGMRDAILLEVKDLLEGAILGLYSSTQPATADDEETGDLLVWITIESGAFNPGSTTNGLVFGDVTHSADNTVTVLAKPAGTEWSGLPVRAGTIGWGRLYSNNRTLGESAVARRIDGQALTVDGADFVISTQRTQIGVPVVCTQLNITLAYQ